jgi:hypothetical protein
MTTAASWGRVALTMRSVMPLIWLTIVLKLAPGELWIGTKILGQRLAMRADVLPIPENGSLGGFQQGRDHTHQACLASAIGSNQS